MNSFIDVEVVAVSSTQGNKSQLLRNILIWRSPADKKCPFVWQLYMQQFFQSLSVPRPRQVVLDKMVKQQKTFVSNTSPNQNCAMSKYNFLLKKLNQTLNLQHWTIFKTKCYLTISICFKDVIKGKSFKKKMDTPYLENAVFQVYKKRLSSFHQKNQLLKFVRFIQKLPVYLRWLETSLLNWRK